MCEHLEIKEFGTYTIRRGGTERTATLLRCSSCKKFVTLDSEEIGEEAILGRAMVTRENMRTVTVQLNSDIYERIENLTSTEGGKEDPSKVMNELLALGLHHYKRIVPKTLY